MPPPPLSHLAGAWPVSPPGLPDPGGRPPVPPRSPPWASTASPPPWRTKRFAAHTKGRGRHSHSAEDALDVTPSNGDVYLGPGSRGREAKTGAGPRDGPGTRGKIAFFFVGGVKVATFLSFLALSLARSLTLS